MDVGVGLAVLGGEAGPRAQRFGGVETGHVTDLGHENGGEDASDAVDGLDGVVAGVVAEDSVDIAVQEDDLAVEGVDEVSQHGDAVEVGVGELEGVELGVAAGAPHVAARREDPVLGHDGVDLGLEPCAHLAELDPEPDHLAQLSGLGRGDPGLGEASEAQQVGQVPGVTLVVFHPTVSPVVAVRIGQMDLVAHFFEEVCSPVPAVGRLDDDVAAHWGGTHRLGEMARFVVDLTESIFSPAWSIR